MFESALGAMMLPHSLVGLDLRRRSRAPLCRVSAPQLICLLWTTSPGARALGMSFNSTTGLSTCLRSSLLEAGATKGRDSRLKIRRIRSGASRDRLEDVVWLDFMAPHSHLDVDVTVTSARTNTNVPRIGACLPLPGSLAFGAQHCKHDTDLRTYALLGIPSPSVQSVHDYYPFAMEDGGRLAPMAA
jgi:hypothetical protein